MTLANWHTYQVLTKRADRLAELLATKLQFAAGQDHIWWGVSVEDREYGLPRIDSLRRAPAAMRFLSIDNGSPVPNRLQQKRAKGRRKPPNSVVISRPSKWGNPFKIDDEHDRSAVVAMFRQWIAGSDPRAEKMRAEIDELRGKDLLCFCPVPGPCHGDVLLELANRSS